MKQCINCGKENPDTAKFCGYCGKALPEAGAQTPPPPPDYDAAPRRTPTKGEPPAYHRPPTVPPPQAGSGTRPGFPPARVTQSSTPSQGGRQRLLVIGAAAVILLLVIICAVVLVINREMIQDTVTGMIDPSTRQTQIANDIQIGLTQTAAVNIDIPATVQAQIALTQSAAGQQPAAPAQNQSAPPAEPTIEAAPPAAQGSEYISNLTEKMKVYVETMTKVDELIAAAQADVNKLSDAQWQADLAAATSTINQTGVDLRQLEAPSENAELHTTAVKAADSLDSAMQLLTEYLTSKNAETLTKAVEAKTQGMTSVTEVQNSISALPSG
jgi:hypothetical protein